MSEKQVNIRLLREQKRRRLRQRKRLGRAMVGGLVAIFIVMTVVFCGKDLWKKNQSFVAQETQLKKEIEKEEARKQEIDELEAYMQSDAYVEEVAKQKLGLAYENEVLFVPK
ncbi:MAG: septum formation initiator family protein [Lachnospiraceae bacterium]|jgi:cell division protein DivIC|nr:septum formation initiator family protein [Lachnospiraceae bacterium]